MKRPTVLDLADAIRPAFERLGFVGQLDVRMDGSRATSWIGKPGGDDVQITVDISPLPPAKSS